MHYFNVFFCKMAALLVTSRSIQKSIKIPLLTKERTIIMLVKKIKLFVFDILEVIVIN